MLLSLLLSFFVSAVMSLVIVRYAHVHQELFHDAVATGPQKFHAVPTPRIGGAPIFLGFMVAGTAAAIVTRHLEVSWFALIVVAALPALLGGLAEDLTKRVGPMPRLLLTFVSAVAGAWLLDGWLSRVDLPLLDDWLQWWPFALLITMLAVGGVAHAMNIIDGYNGLAGMVSVLILAALAYVCYKLNDKELLVVCVALIGAIGGFLIWNYPRGLIFAGDGGAYFLGFMIAEISVLLVNRHPQVSPWFPLLLVLYPVWETLFSIWRKKMVRGHSPGIPDGLHLHMLIYKRLVRWAVGSRESKHITKRNSATSPYLWGMASLTVVPALVFWRRTEWLMIISFLFIVLYVWLYLRIVRFKAPRWLIARGKEQE